MNPKTLLAVGALLPGAALAQSGIVSDDFSGATLGAQWTHVDPLGDTGLALQGFGSEDAQVVFSLPAGTNHDLWYDENHAPRLLQNCNDVDFEVEAKWDSALADAITSHGIVVQESMTELLRFEFLATASDDFLFAAHVGDSNAQTLEQTELDGGIPSYMRVTRTGDTWCIHYSYDGVTFSPCAEVEYELTANQIGPFAINYAPDGNAPALDSRVDYFFDTASPIVPEDGLGDSEIPIADAGDAQAIHAGNLVALDGSGSTDDTTATPDLVYDWSLVSAPAGSAAMLAGADTISPSFVADLPGVYVVELVVTDMAGFMSEPSTVEISSENLAPTADAGGEELVGIGSTVVLDGLDSFDPDGDAITFQWTLVSLPPGSAAVLMDDDTATPSLTPDVAGDYVLELVVSDAFSSSDPDDLVVTAVAGNDVAVDKLKDLACDLRWEPSSKFTCYWHKRWMRRQLRRAAHAIECGWIGWAEWRLDRAQRRTDGCVLRGAPDAWIWCWIDRPDVVVDCDLQHVIYDTIQCALDILAAND